jgi:transglutaminase-like putative cysteine protease/predicted glutamine amidotransferase
MPSFLAMSFEGALSPSFDLRCLNAGHALPDGWGIGFYGGNEPAATVLKEPNPSTDSVKSRLVESWEHLESSVVMMHIRAARWGSIEDANTQPFLRTWGGRDWLFVHSGSLESRPELGVDALFEPVGSTDTEFVFCELMNRIARQRWKSLREVDPRVLQGWLEQFNELGVLTCALTDGSDVLVYADGRGHQLSLLWELKPPYDEVVFGDDELQVNLTRRGAKARKGVIIASQVLESEGEGRATWRELAPGSLVIVRQGALLHELPPKRAPAASAKPGGENSPPESGVRDETSPSPSVSTRSPLPHRPRTAPPRRLEIAHRTVYRYEKPVERSTHLFRFEPVTDLLQRLARHELRISVEGKWRDYTDVFGNRARRVVIERPYTELAIESHALVVALDTSPFELRPLHARTTIPLNWMPWQRHMLQPYLLPPELPESQLVELHEYAMSFVERNDYDLVDSLIDINQSLFRDYTYKQHSTTVLTTPFDVYANRRGVCQDFTNLFICLARLLNIPARYVCGYLYTGPKHHNRAMAEATHAWAQVYLPETGWRGFDPTNGVLTQTDHVRVAVGRNFMDATPTSGTIFVGGGPETLEVAVSCEEVG